ncbi:hypothetical protein PYW08_009422 [Mythimna loreyi]|uniref:Uncharacterized protein n=1 Tax=Mythimna loreyi TaxID=667449 RepID=A0ACC2QDG9_9NEOP|nr:hypothetical protein PYW08_009422 [Mythimna loreyi]
MTNFISLVVALSLLINEIHILYDSRILKNKFFTSNLVYLLSICLLLREIELFPFLESRKYYLLCYLLEVPITIILLEGFLYCLWKPIQDYLLYNADAILVNLAEERGLEWLVCHMCCGQSNCTTIFAALPQEARLPYLSPSVKCW